MEICKTQLSSFIDNNQVLLTVIGVVFVSSACYSLISTVWKTIKPFCRIHAQQLKIYGDYAIVTEASSYMGRSYSFELARRGMKVIMIGTELEGLKATADEIRSACGVDCSYIQVDFTQGDVFRNIDRFISDKDIGILVNVGDALGKEPCLFLNDSEESVYNTIETNMSAVLNMTRLVLPKMLEKRSGAIINFSALISAFPVPTISQYCSSKAFVTHFTQSLANEYRCKGIDIQTLVPYSVKRSIKKGLQERYSLTPNGDVYCRSALSTLGLSEFTTGYWPHAIAYFVWHLFSHLISKTFKVKANKCD